MSELYLGYSKLISFLDLLAEDCADKESTVRQAQAHRNFPFKVTKGYAIVRICIDHNCKS